jgi:hypothetical protein
MEPIINYMSSTRDSVTGARDDPHVVLGLKSQVRECQEMINDLQKLNELNKRTISLLCQAPIPWEKVINPIIEENCLLFNSLSRSLQAHKKSDTESQTLRLRLEQSEMMVQRMQEEMSKKITQMRNIVSKSEQDSTPGGKKLLKRSSPEKNNQLSTDRASTGVREAISHKCELETLQNLLTGCRENIHRLKLEKKELLKTNFVVDLTDQEP